VDVYVLLSEPLSDVLQHVSGLDKLTALTSRLPLTKQVP